MTNPVAFAFAKLIVELRGRFALAGNWLESTGFTSTSVSFMLKIVNLCAQEAQMPHPTGRLPAKAADSWIRFI